MKDKLYSVVFTFLISTFFVLVLAAINALASSRIEINEKLDFQRSVLYVFGFVEIEDNLSSEEIQSLYAEKITELTGEITVYVATVKGEKNYAFTVQSPGLWGTITGLVAVSSDASRIVGIDFVSHSETPGLGGRIDEKSFKEQFRDERISQDRNLRIAVVSGIDTSSNDDSRVDAITGATRTSEAVGKLINKAINEIFPTVLKVVN